VNTIQSWVQMWSQTFDYEGSRVWKSFDPPVHASADEQLRLFRYLALVPKREDVLQDLQAAARGPASPTVNYAFLPDPSDLRHVYTMFQDPVVYLDSDSGHGSEGEDEVINVDSNAGLLRFFQSLQGSNPPSAVAEMIQRLQQDEEKARNETIEKWRSCAGYAWLSGQYDEVAAITKDVDEILNEQDGTSAVPKELHELLAGRSEDDGGPAVTSEEEAPAVIDKT